MHSMYTQYQTSFSNTAWRNTWFQHKRLWLTGPGVYNIENVPTHFYQDAPNNFCCSTKYNIQVITDIGCQWEALFFSQVCSCNNQNLSAKTQSSKSGPVKLQQSLFTCDMSIEDHSTTDKIFFKLGKIQSRPIKNTIHPTKLSYFFFKYAQLMTEIKMRVKQNSFDIYYFSSSPPSQQPLQLPVFTHLLLKA